jgi:hypothetical protein
MTDISESLAKQFMKCVTLHRHQLAGQAANLDFWSDEVQHCLDVIDGYKTRFTRMRDAQMKHAAEHQTSEYNLDPDDPCCFPGKVVPPRRIDYRELEAAKQSLCDATRRFLVRCREESLIDETTFRETAARFRIPLEASDVER